MMSQFFDIDLEHIELQIVSLLQRLLFLAHSDAMPPLRATDLNSIKFSPLANLTLYCFVFGICTSTPKTFGSIKFAELPDTLSRSKAFPEVTTDSLDVLNRRSTLYRKVAHITLSLLHCVEPIRQTPIKKKLNRFRIAISHKVKAKDQANLYEPLCDSRISCLEYVISSFIPNMDQIALS